VPNIPGVVARTSVHAFMNSALPYISELANLGIDNAVDRDSAIASALNTYKGEVRQLTRFGP
jgi:alanine dehydrogenase